MIRGSDTFIILNESEFTVINLEGPDAYWLHTKPGAMREYFKRIK